jgi:transcriptional regulator with XRE-family HTH domain
MTKKISELPKLAAFLRERCAQLNLTPKKISQRTGISIRAIYPLFSGLTPHVRDIYLSPIATCLECKIEDIYNHTEKKWQPTAQTKLGEILLKKRIACNLSATELAKMLGISIEAVRAQENNRSEKIRHVTARMFSDIFCIKKQKFIEFLNEKLNPTKSIFGKRMRFYRQGQLLSLEDLAKMLNLTKQLLSQYEHGNCLPSKNTLQQIAFFLKADFNELLSCIQRDVLKKNKLYKTSGKDDLTKINLFKLRTLLKITQEEASLLVGVAEKTFYKAENGLLLKSPCCLKANNILKDEVSKQGLLTT